MIPRLDVTVKRRNVEFNSVPHALVLHRLTRFKIVHEHVFHVARTLLVRRTEIVYTGSYSFPRYATVFARGSARVGLPSPVQQIVLFPLALVIFHVVRFHVFKFPGFGQRIQISERSVVLGYHAQTVGDRLNVDRVYDLSLIF